MWVQNINLQSTETWCINVPSAKYLSLNLFILFPVLGMSLFNCRSVFCVVYGNGVVCGPDGLVNLRLPNKV